MGPHDDGRLTGGQLGEDPTALSGGGGAGQQVDAGGAFGATEHPEAGHGPQNRFQRGVVLGGEDLGGGQEGGLPSTSDHLKHGAQSHEGLATSHVALEKALHGNGAGQVGGDLLTDPQLAGGQVVWQAGVEVRSQGVLRLRYGPGDRGAGRLMVGSALS